MDNSQYEKRVATEKLPRAVDQLLSRIYKLVLVWLWRQKQSAKSFVYRHVSTIGYLGIIAELFDIVLEWLHVSGALRTATWLINGLVLVAIILLFPFKWNERREHERQQVFLTNMHRVVTALDGLVFDLEQGDEGTRKLQSYIDRILEILWQAFAWRGGLNANVMLFQDERLVMRFIKADFGIEYDEAFRPLRGQGGAGLCFDEQAIIYFPDIQWRHGIKIELPDNSDDQMHCTVCLDQYARVSIKYEKHLCSILCVPVAAYHECYGVLNVDSKYSDPFSEGDFLAMAFFGTAIGLALSRYRAVYG